MTQEPDVEDQAPQLVPLNAIFATDFVQILVPVTTASTMREVAAAVAHHVEGRRVRALLRPSSPPRTPICPLCNRRATGSPRTRHASPAAALAASAAFSTSVEAPPRGWRPVRHQPRAHA